MFIKKLSVSVSICGVFCFAGLAQGKWIHMVTLGDGAISAFAVHGVAMFAALTGIGAYRSLNNGTSWTAADTGLTSKSVQTLAVNGNAIFAGTPDSGVFISTNNGSSWSAVNNGLMKKDIFSLTAASGFLFAGGEGIFRLPDNDAQWAQMDSGHAVDGYVMALATIDKTIFAGASAFDGLGHWDGSVDFSIDNGISWVNVKNFPVRISPLYSPSLQVLALTVSGNSVFAGTSQGVYRAINNGTLWTVVDSGLAHTMISALAATGDTVFAGTGKGVFVSINNEALWTEANSGLTDTAVTALAVINSYVFIGTGNGNVWRRPLSEMVSNLPLNRPNANVPKKTRLSAFENMYTGIKMKYSLASRCLARLVIYSINGKQITSFEQGEQAPGEYSVRLAGELLPAGLYVCRFQAGSYLESNLLKVIK